MTSSRHVIVCGAGVVGASVAYFLARRGVRVTVVERTGVACAASGKSGGFLALDWCDNTPVEGLARTSFALHATLPDELGVDYGYRRMDTYMLTARETGRLAGGHRVPAPAWIDGPAIVAGTIGTPETTAQVHPARFTEALLEAARASGAVLRVGVVEAVVVRDGVARGVVVDGAPLEADAVVLALGPWTGRVGGVRLPRVRGLKGYSVTLAAPDVPPHALFVDYRTADGGALAVAQGNAAVAFDEVLDEEIHLPRQLLDVEGDAVGDVSRRRELRAAPLQRVDQRDRLAIERRVFRPRRRAEMRLQRHIAEILQRDDAERIGMTEDRGHRHGHAAHEPSDVGKRQPLELDGLRMDGQHL